MNETEKSYQIRDDRGDFERYLTGNGIDIGCGPDPLQVKEGKVDPWDLPQGDAQYLEGVKSGSYDFLYSSHCLEHLVDIPTSLKNWTRVVKVGGFVYFTVPEYTIYEKIQWPSIYNSDHKHSFSVWLGRDRVKRDNHWGLRHLDSSLRGAGLQPVSVLLEDEGYDYSLPPEIDQTMSGALAQICVISERVS